MAGEKKTFVSDQAMKPTEQIKRYIVQLSKDCTDHLSQAYTSDKERYAFATKTKVFSILLEPHTASDIKTATFKSYDDLETEVKKLKDQEMNEETRKKNMIRIQYDYALPIFEQSLRILMNSPIVEVEAEGIIDLAREGLKDRVRQKDTAEPIRKTELEILESDQDSPVDLTN